MKGIRGADFYEGDGTNGLGDLGTHRNGDLSTVVIQCAIDTTGGGGYSRLFDTQMGNVATAGSGQFDIYRPTSATTALATIPAGSGWDSSYNIFGFFFPDSLTCTDIKFYKNGTAKAVTFYQNGTGTVSGKNGYYPHYLGGNSGNTRNIDGRIRCYYEWNRELSPAEHLLLARDPWTFWVWDIETSDLGLGGPYTIESNLTTFTNVARSGSGMSWQNLSNAQTSNDSSANTYVPGAAPIGVYTTDYLVGSDLVKTIPDASVIAGIEVDVERKRDGSHNEKDSQVRLRRAGVLESTDKADTSTVWPTTDTVKTYGSTTDKWSASWSRADLNDSGFGVAISITGDAGGGGGGGSGE